MISFKLVSPIHTDYSAKKNNIKCQSNFKCKRSKTKHQHQVKDVNNITCKQSLIFVLIFIEVKICLNEENSLTAQENPLAQGL